MKRSELKQIIKEVIEEETNNDIEYLINEFKLTLTPSDYKRDNCKTTSYSFYLFMKNHNYNVPIIQGFYKVETPKLVKRDFTNDEIIDATKKGFNVSNKDDLYTYAEELGLIEELSFIPHVWNKYKDDIIDITGYHQFVKSKMSPNLKKENYFIPDEIPQEFEILKNFY